MRCFKYLLYGLLFGSVSNGFGHQISARNRLSPTIAANACPLSPHVVGYPSGGPRGNNDWYANVDRTIWATFWGWDFVLRGGEQKVLWYKPFEYPIVVTGRRIDGVAPPLVYDISRDPRRRGPIQPSGLAFPTVGCWEVNAQAGNSELHFVVLVKATTPVKEYRATLADLTKRINDQVNLTKQQLAHPIAGDVAFPGRDEWEQRLYAQKEELVAVMRTASNVLQRMLDAPTAEERDPTKLKLNLDNATSSVGSAYVQYEQLVSEGVRRAAYWKQLH